MSRILTLLSLQTMTTAQFTAALKSLPPPSARMRKLLKAHVAAPNHVLTMRVLAEKAG